MGQLEIKANIYSLYYVNLVLCYICIASILFRQDFFVVAEANSLYMVQLYPSD